MRVLDVLGDMFWSQLVRGPTHRDGNTLDLCISSPELVAGVEVIQPLGTSYQHPVNVRDTSDRESSVLNVKIEENA